MWGLWLWALAANAGVTWAEHGVRTQGEQVVVESRFELDRVEAFALARPLPASVAVRGAPVQRDAAGQVVGVRPEARVVQLEVVASELEVPVAAGPLPQRVVLQELLFEPEPALGLEERVGGWVEPGIRPKERMKLRRKRARGQTVWVTGAGVGQQGLRGALRPRGPVPLGVVAGVFALFAAVLGGLYIGYRWLERLARAERLERYMSDEFVQAELAGEAPPR